MKRIGVIGLSAAAALVMAVATSTAAYAAPEFLTKAVVGEGESRPYTDTLGAAYIEGQNGTKITCTSGTAKGEMTGAASIANDVITYTGCESAGFKFESGETEGLIETHVLAGKLGAVAATLPGIKLFSQSEGKGGKIAEFSGAGGSIPVLARGEITGSLSSAAGTNAETGQLVSSMKVSYAEAKGIQKYQGFVEGPEKEVKGQEEWSFAGNQYEPWAQSLIETRKPVPASWQFGVTKPPGPTFLTQVAVQEGQAIPLTGSFGATVLERTDGVGVTCTGGSAAGQVTGPIRLSQVVLTFTGCQTGAGATCQSGTAEGVVVTNALSGTLGGLSATLPGVRLFPEATGRGGELAAFSCAAGAITFKVKGSVTGSLSGAVGTSAETGNLQASVKLAFAQTKGTQKYAKFLEGEAGTEQLQESVSVVNGGEYANAGLSVTSTLKTVPATWEIGVTK
jgi:hypothetical protein